MRQAGKEWNLTPFLPATGHGAALRQPVDKRACRHRVNMEKQRIGLSRCMSLARDDIGLIKEEFPHAALKMISALLPLQDSYDATTSNNHSSACVRYIGPDNIIGATPLVITALDGYKVYHQARTTMCFPTQSIMLTSDAIQRAKRKVVSSKLSNHLRAVTTRYSTTSPTSLAFDCYI